MQTIEVEDESLLSDSDLISSLKKKNASLKRANNRLKSKLRKKNDMIALLKGTLKSLGVKVNTKHLE